MAGSRRQSPNASSRVALQAQAAEADGGWEEVQDDDSEAEDFGTAAARGGDAAASARDASDASDSSYDTASEDGSEAEDRGFRQLWDLFDAAEAGEACARGGGGAHTSAAAPDSDKQSSAAAFAELSLPWGASGLHAGVRGAADSFTIRDEMLDCEDAEWSAIEGFMNQVGIQIHLMHGDAGRASVEAVHSMQTKARDQHSHVHIWYWSGAIAQHRRRWGDALAFFRRAVRCTHIYLHLSMQAKALVACCEAVLGYFVNTHFPALLNTSFGALWTAADAEPRRYATLLCTPSACDVDLATNSCTL